MHWQSRRGAREGDEPGDAQGGRRTPRRSDEAREQLAHPSVDVEPGYFALFEDNDPAGRMIALANHNNDIAEYWEWSAEGLYNPDPTSNAYRLGVNYFVYALTH